MMAIASSASSASQLLRRSRRRGAGALAGDTLRQILAEVTGVLRARRERLSNWLALLALLAIAII